jgi:hypothetical protein
MGVISTQGFTFRLLAGDPYQQLDIFEDEDIKMSNNVTGLFDIGVLPSDFTRQITLPGTKVNNAFFEHVYDISIDSPFLFATNQKVPAYFDFDSVFLSQGYLQLNKVNVIANKFIDSYEVTIYGTLSSFARTINRAFLTDLTGSLSQYNHTSSLANITSSWGGNLFNGDIVYPLAEYGQQISYTPEENQFGIDSPSGSLCVQDFKPSIRIKKVWDAIFDYAGYTYTSSFWEQSWLDNVYMVCNNQLRYPVYSGSIDLETYGLFKVGPLSGSGTDVLLNAGTVTPFPYFNIQQNQGGQLDTSLNYTLGFSTELRGELQLNFEISASGTPGASGYPTFDLIVSGSSGNTTTPLTNINNFMYDTAIYNNNTIRTQKFELLTPFNTSILPSGIYRFYIKYTKNGDTNFNVILNPDNNVKGYLSITKVNQGGDGLVMKIGDNMPFGTTGIKLVDWIRGIQQKFNLVIYPSKINQREFIVETFNDWYNKGERKDFNRYINLDEKIEVIPANNLAVNKLNFGDTLDGDYISQQFAKQQNREFGKSYYVDTNNFYSQGTFEVKTTLASSPLIRLAGTGQSGSALLKRTGFQAFASLFTTDPDGSSAESSISANSEQIVRAIAVRYSPGSETATDPISGYAFRSVQEGTIIDFFATPTGDSGPTTIAFKKINDAGTTTLSTSSSYSYTVTASDISQTTLNFTAEVYST